MHLEGTPTAVSLGLEVTPPTGFLAKEALKGSCVRFGKTSRPGIPGRTFPPSRGGVAWAAWILAEPGLSSAGDFPKSGRLCKESPTQGGAASSQSHA